MKNEEVADYLQNNPQFFEEHAEMLANVTLPHPYGGRTISLSERQLLTLREKNKALEKKLHELLEFARENDGLQLKVHQFACELYGAHDLDTLRDMILQQMRERFAVPHVAMHLWELDPPSPEIQTFSDEMPQPVCMHRAMYDTETWFGDSAQHLRSYAYLPLRNAESNSSSIGMLVLASEEAQRFYPEMGTLFLQRIAEIASCALRAQL